MMLMIIYYTMHLKKDIHHVILQKVGISFVHILATVE